MRYVPLIWLHQANFRFPALYNAQRAGDPRYIPHDPSIKITTEVTMHLFSRAQNLGIPLFLTAEPSALGDCCCTVSTFNHRDADQHNARE
jgi:hypothetical protein